MEKVNLTFYPNRVKKSAKTGKIPIYLRLYDSGKLEVRVQMVFVLKPLAMC